MQHSSINEIINIGASEVRLVREKVNERNQKKNKIKRRIPLIREAMTRC